MQSKNDNLPVDTSKTRVYIDVMVAEAIESTRRSIAIDHEANRRFFEQSFPGIPYEAGLSEEQQNEAANLTTYTRTAATEILRVNGKQQILNTPNDIPIPFFNPVIKRESAYRENPEIINRELSDSEKSGYTLATQDIPVQTGNHIQLIVGSLGNTKPHQSTRIVIAIPTLDSFKPDGPTRKKFTTRGTLVIPLDQPAELWSRFMNYLIAPEPISHRFVRTATPSDINFFKQFVDYATRNQTSIAL